jgi:CheY-like chemotaxis protein
MIGAQSLRTVVLVIEDEPVLRMNMVDLVEEAGFEAAEAANSQQAMRLLESRSDISIILSDIEMPPGLDGMALAAMVRDRWPPIAIILVSGQVDFGDVKMPEGGVFFSKPCRPADVVNALHRMAA